MNSSRRELAYFFVITFLWAWLLNLPRVLDTAGLITIPAALSMTLGYLAVFGPSVAAFGLTAHRSGKDGVKKLLKRGWKTGFKKIWWIPTLLLVPAAGGLTVLILNLLKYPIAWEARQLSPGMIVPIGMLIWLLGAYPEEFGWRGYALDRLQEKYSPLVASLILGLIWGLWHLPLHFIEGTTQFYIPVVEFVLQIVVLSLLYTWLHNGSGGSVLVASLFHLTGNLTGALIPYWTSRTGRWIGLLPLLVGAILVIVFNWSRFSRRKQTRV